jgi:hypothetical protein
LAVLDHSICVRKLIFLGWVGNIKRRIPVLLLNSKKDLKIKYRKPIFLMS